MWCSRQTLCFWKCFITFLILLSWTRSLLNHHSSLRASMMRRNNLEFLEKNCAKKCNLRELLTQLALVLVTRLGPWQARQVESTLFWQLCKLWGGLSSTQCDLRSFFKDIHHHHHHHQSSSSSYHHHHIISPYWPNLLRTPLKEKGSRKYFHLWIFWTCEVLI